MGASNVTAAFLATSGQGLSPSAKLLLIRMAVTALDGDETPRYFAGWELLARSLDYSEAELERGTPTREAARRHVRRLVGQLVTAGLVERRGYARSGRNAEYVLRLRRTRVTPLPSGGFLVQGDACDPSQGDVHDPPRGGSQRSAEGDACDPSKENEEPGTGAITGEQLISQGESHQGRAHLGTELDEDPEYAAARATIDRLGPHRYQAVLDTVCADQPNLPTRDLMIAVANRARNGAPR